MQIQIKATSVYPDEMRSSIQFVDIPAPDSNDKDDLDDWAAEHLLQFTGTGRTSGYAGYSVKILQCEDRPELVGFEVESYG